ncbi:MAG: beta-ketoacyl reductase, partial [Pseudomonadota bacterium]
VLITGGLGALGLSVATMAADAGASGIILMGRREPDETACSVIETITASGIPIATVAGDVTSEEDVAEALAAARKFGPIDAVYHLAGATDDRAFESITRESFAKVFGAKTRGAQILARALYEERDATLILFSSVASALGSAGQVSYAAANGYLEGLAEALRAGGRQASAVSWGPWVPAAKGGLAATDAVLRAAARYGVRPLSDEEAADLLAIATSAQTPHLVAIAADFARYRTEVAGHPRAAFLSALDLTEPTAAPNAAAVSEAPKGWLYDRAAPEPADARTDTLREEIAAMVASALGEDGPIDQSEGFVELGLDSIMAIDLRARLNHALAQDLPATVAIDYPTVAQLADYIAESFFAETVAAEPAAATQPAPQPAAPQPPLEEDELADLSSEDLIAMVQDDLNWTEGEH